MGSCAGAGRAIRISSINWVAPVLSGSHLDASAATTAVHAKCSYFSGPRSS